VDYLLEHLAVIDRLNDDGMKIEGYFTWSLMDNFEWSFGFSKRFGLIYTDYTTQQRIKRIASLPIISSLRRKKQRASGWFCRSYPLTECLGQVRLECGGVAATSF
jgi:beta-glucosidase